MSEWQLFGVRGWGSSLAEAMLDWVGEPYAFVDVAGFDRPGEARERLLAVNPLARVPTLIGPDGQALTESAAIAFHLAERHPEAGLAPPPGDPLRASFLNRLVWFVSALYPTFTFRDYPERWAPEAADQLVERIDSYRRSLWEQFESQTGEGPWVLGERPSALDVYVGAMSHWRPRRAWLKARCPKLHGIAERADAFPPIAAAMLRNFPPEAAS
ncbi:glutathione S-transferase family protein [Sphingosinicella sp. CPCC 101087]|uniref:glutathione S-transferase family protein n=1 Tax=Sphingosinicella sp. CPCC 101087 TaxID=2497754 RepID=UPI00101C6CF0|nr:glutathione S-transferase family protein [Sphingosinicella sp. CPCC 101087]